MITADVEFQLTETAQAFRALSEPARLRILVLLREAGELCNCQIEAVTGYTNTKISRHLQALKQARLLQFRREGTWIFYSLRAPQQPVHAALQEMLPQMSQWHEVFTQDLARWREVSQLPLNQVCSNEPSKENS